METVRGRSGCMRVTVGACAQRTSSMPLNDKLNAGWQEHDLVWRCLHEPSELLLRWEAYHQRQMRFSTAL